MNIIEQTRDAVQTAISALDRQRDRIVQLEEEIAAAKPVMADAAKSIRDLQVRVSTLEMLLRGAPRWESATWELGGLMKINGEHAAFWIDIYDKWTRRVRSVLERKP